MEPILPVKDYMKSLTGQFVPTMIIDMLDEKGNNGKAAIEVRRLSDDKIFRLDNNIYSAAFMVNDICIVEEVSIESFHEDFIHVDITAYRHSDDYRLCVGASDTIEINDVEDYIIELLAEVREDFRVKHPEIQ